MHLRRFSLILASFSLAIILSAPALAAKRDGNSGTVPVTVTVTVLGTNNQPAPEIPQEDVIVRTGNGVRKVIGWERARAQQGPLQLAVLIDDNVRTDLIGQQFDYIANFIQSQAPSTEVALYYAEHGSAYAATPFTTDHQKVARALHLTLGLRNGESPSIYLSLSDLAKHWPASPGTRREVVVFGSGNDPLNPGIVDPYADEASDDVVKAGLTVHVIPIAGTRYTFSFRGEISAGKLIQISDNTGGQTVGGELGAPISLTPYLNQLNRIFRNQYLLTFAAQAPEKKNGEVRDLQVRLEEHNVKVWAPKQVLIPGR
jgi:hypothetical protein